MLIFILRFCQKKCVFFWKLFVSVWPSQRLCKSCFENINCVHWRRKSVSLSINFVPKYPMCDHWNESLWAILSCGTVYYVVQGGGGGGGIEMKAIEQFFHVILFSMLYKASTSKSVDEILVLDHLNESFWAVLSCGGGGGTGGSEPPASRTLLSRFPFLYLPPPALSRTAPVLSWTTLI